MINNNQRLELYFRLLKENKVIRTQKDLAQLIERQPQTISGGIRGVQPVSDNVIDLVKIILEENKINWKEDEEKLLDLEKSSSNKKEKLSDNVIELQDRLLEAQKKLMKISDTNFLKHQLELNEKRIEILEKIKLLFEENLKAKKTKDIDSIIRRYDQYHKEYLNLLSFYQKTIRIDT